MAGIDYEDKTLLNNSIVAKIFPNSTFAITAKNLQQTLEDIVETLWRDEEKRNYLVYSNITQQVINDGTDGTTDEFYLDFGKFKQGDGFRIRAYGYYNSVTDLGGIVIQLNTVYKDVNDNKQQAGIDSWIFPKDAIAGRWIAEFEVYFDPNTQNFSYTGIVNTTDTPNLFINNDRAGTPPLSTFGKVGIELITTVNGGDNLIIEGVTVEHIVS